MNMLLFIIYYLLFIIYYLLFIIYYYFFFKIKLYGYVNGIEENNNDKIFFDFYKSILYIILSINN
jgi:hypothetical protein